MKLGLAHPMGPLALADLIGLDTCYAVIKVLHEGFGDSKYRPCPIWQQMVDAGYLGRGSGTGKSVLLRTIVGLIKPTAGNIEIFGHNLAQLSARDRRAYEIRWGVLFQDGALFSSLTVAQNVQVPLREHLQLSPGLMNEIAALKISMAGLPASSGAKFPGELSGGMRKRAGLARALALDPAPSRSPVNASVVSR